MFIRLGFGTSAADYLEDPGTACNFISKHMVVSGSLFQDVDVGGHMCVFIYLYIYIFLSSLNLGI